MRPNDAKFVQYDAKVLPKDAIVVQYDTILNQEYKNSGTQEDWVCLGSFFLKTGLRLEALGFRNKRLTVILMILKLGSFCVFLVHRLHGFSPILDEQ